MKAAQAELATLRARAEQAEARAAELEDVLEPLLGIAGEGTEDYPDDARVTVLCNRATHYSTLGEFRRAQAAYGRGDGSPVRALVPEPLDDRPGEFVLEVNADLRGMGEDGQLVLVHVNDLHSGGDAYWQPETSPEEDGAVRALVEALEAARGALSDRQPSSNRMAALHQIDAALARRTAAGTRRTPPCGDGRGTPSGRG